MNHAEYRSLLSERSSLERMIADTPLDDVIDLRSLQVRLEIVNKQLEEQPQETRLPAQAKLTFRGRPVVGSHGIFAEFGMAATKAFTDTVALLAASFETELSATGPIPNRGQNQLLITNTALGSFGFQLEEYREDLLPPTDESPVALALKETQELIQGAASGSDDELTDSASGQDPRAMAALSGFLKTLIDNEAVCALAIGEKTFAFTDVGEVRKSWSRLAQENLHSAPTTLEGWFEGALPKRKSFEFKVTATGEVIAGKIASGVSDVSVINKHLYKTVAIQLMATRVGQGKPRYVLNQLPTWE
jgi:hypothetical protein